MSILLSDDIISKEISLLATVVIGVVCYVAVVLFFFNKNEKSGIRGDSSSENQGAAQDLWNDTSPSLQAFPLSNIFSYGSVFEISAFSSSCLLNRVLPSVSSQSTLKLCVSRSHEDTEKLLHPLIKKIESRLRRAEIRPRPRLRLTRTELPYPLFSATRADQELTNYVLEFLDASIDLSVSCDTQVNFALDCQKDGIRISAVWSKNQLISDATSQIELLNDMRLTFQGETIRWEYQLFICPNADVVSTDHSEEQLQQTAS